MRQGAEILDRLATVIAEKARHSPEHSYTAQLLAQGQEHILRKVGEEALEVILAASHARTPRQQIATESADLLYHLLVLWQQAGIEPETVWQELARRQERSGLAEKAGRTANTGD